MPMMPVRKPYGGGAGMAASAAGGPASTGMSAAVPQVGRMNAPPPMPMGGQGQQVMPPIPAPSVPGMMGGDPGGGPMAPQNIGSMLSPAQQPPDSGPPLAPWGQDQYTQPGGGGGDVGMGMGGDQNVGGMGNEHSHIPMIMLKLMQLLGHI